MPMCVGAIAAGEDVLRKINTVMASAGVNAGPNKLRSYEMKRGWLVDTKRSHPTKALISSLKKISNERLEIINCIFFYAMLLGKRLG
jgi:hypothetical protein